MRDSLWQARTSTWVARLGLCAVVLPLTWVLSLLLSGCGSDPRENTAGSQKPKNVSQTVSSLDLAMQAVATMSVSKDNDNANRALHYLNQWIMQLDAPAEKFQRDPLLAFTPRAYEKSHPLQELDRRRFDSPDLFYLQQCLWLRDIARRVAPREAPAQLQPWLKEREKQLGITDAERLRTAERLFDWTICSVQLDALPPPPRPAMAGAGKNDVQSLPAPIRGEKGPGYWQLPWQTLLYGHGDSWQRSRVFLQMCRQLDIPAHMLGVQDESGSGAVRPWLCGVLIKGQLYLFDARLGLPIPGPEGKGIATLEQVVADPGLIRALDIAGESPYPITEGELKSVTALLDAEPQSLTYRMKVLESALIGEKRVVLYCQPSELEKEVRQCKHISGASIWRISLEAVMFQIAQSVMRARDPKLEAAHRQETFMFFPPHPLAEARHLHFQGQFDAQGEKDKPGALQLYFSLRLPNTAIESLETSAEARRLLGVRDEMLPKDTKARNQRLSDSTRIAKILKDHATYWIGLSHFDSGDHVAAKEWFEVFTLQDTPDSQWHPAARYNLARCYEAEGDWEGARQLYLDDESPQKHGNLLRAQRLPAAK